MLRKFSLYGFLKNQQYYEYFILLAFIQMGLSYLVIGLLIAFREIVVNIMEIPSGAYADLCGRRYSMILSFLAYIVSFSVFGISGIAASNYALPMNMLIPLLFLAMLFFAIGEAFRTGTHKALIFAWLRIQGRIDDRTKVYGYTRSWSKIGSAVSVVIACIIVFLTSNFIYVFFFSIIPYVLNIINFRGYPKEIDCKMPKKLSFKEIFAHLKETITFSFSRRSLRRLILESMGFEGFFKASKDYLQPVLMAAAIPLSAVLFSDVQLNDEQKAVILIGPVFFILFLLSAFASRNAHRFVSYTGDEEQTARKLWLFITILFIVMLPAMFFQIHWIIITGFVSLYIIQNVWRPVLISRIDAHSDEEKGATVLSIESQAKSLSTMIIAPLLGFSIDIVRVRNIGAGEFWPVGLFGVLIAGGFLITAKNRNKV